MAIETVDEEKSGAREEGSNGEGKEKEESLWAGKDSGKMILLLTEFVAKFRPGLPHNSRMAVSLEQRRELLSLSRSVPSAGKWDPVSMELV